MSNDLVRRLCNTGESMGARELCKVVDDYAQKLLNSGYSHDETKSIILRGIKGYEGRKNRCRAEGRSLWRTAAESGGARQLKKLTANTSWFKNRKKRNFYGRRSNAKKEHGRDDVNKDWEQKSILFVEQTKDGELGKQLREVVMRLAPILGFGIKIVERTGSNLKSKFPQASLWEGSKCGREKCVTCEQGAEVTAPCTRKSLVYENICGECNQGAKGKEEVTGGNPDIPSIYVGETSRTIFERANEHWGAALGSTAARSKSHMAKHQEMVHEGREPKFIMRVVKFHRTALSRQIGEAIRIRRRGGEGAVLNSKGEFNRSFIPGLQLVEEERVKEVEQAEEEDLRQSMVELDARDGYWESTKVKERTVTKTGWSKGNSSSVKRPIGSKEGRPRKKLKHDVIPRGWGNDTMVEQMVENGDTTRTKTTFGSKDDYDVGGATISLLEDGDVPTPPPYVENGGGGTNNIGCGDHPTPPPISTTTYPDTRDRVELYYGGGSLRREAPSDGEKTAPSTVSPAMSDVILECEEDDTTFGGEGVVNKYRDTSTRGKDDSGDSSMGDARVDGEADVDKCGDECAAAVTPSVTEYCGKKAEYGTEESNLSVSRSVGVNNEMRCIIKNGVCSNGCDTKTIKVSVKKRVQNKKTLLWSDRSRKVDKFICVKKYSEHANLANSGTQE